MEEIMTQLNSLSETQKGVEKSVGKLVDAGQSKYWSEFYETGTQSMLCSSTTRKDHQMARNTNRR
jgi:hypothetical protein